MKNIILIFSAITLIISCAQPEFCGTMVKNNPAENLQGQISGNGFSLGLQLSMIVAKQIEERKEISYEVIYSTEDTLVVNILNIPNEEFAKKISCIVQENKIIQNTKTTYITYNWDKGTKSLGY